MSNVATSKFEPVAGETRYRKYFKPEGIRIRFIILSNYGPGHFYWRDELNDETKQMREA